MELGMVGLGRMGANMARRLVEGGHSCVVFDRSPPAVGELAQDRAIGTASLTELASRLARPRAIWPMVPAAVVDKTVTEIVPHLEVGTILIDSGNSYYVDDTCSLCERFSSRGEADFAAKVLPSMRYQFGGYLEDVYGQATAA